MTPPPDSAAPIAPPPSTWDSTAGAALFIAGTTPREAFVILPRLTDSTALDTATADLGALESSEIDLFSAGKRVGLARVGSRLSATTSDSCRPWPTINLIAPPGDTAVATGWSVGFTTGHAEDVALDSIDVLSAPDSSRLAADVARLASALPGDTAAVFRGLPFVVQKAWRSAPIEGRQLLAALVVRNVNQEANPRQERILIIADRDTTPSARYTTRYWERVAGAEETLESTDLIGLVMLGRPRHPAFVVTRDTGHGSSFGLIERVAGHWAQRWSSAYGGC